MTLLGLRMAWVVRRDDLVKLEKGLEGLGRAWEVGGNDLVRPAKGLGGGRR